MDNGGGAGAVLTLIRTVEETGSTNTDLLAWAASGHAEEGLWLRAELQTAGRGRQGRAWVSPPGNLHASTLVRLRSGDPAAATLALVAAVALDEATRVYLPDAGDLQLKWPNDLLLGPAKLAGILAERAGDHVVVGIGMNLAHHPDLSDRLTTSLASRGVHVGPDTFVDTLIEGFVRWLGRWRAEGLELVRRRWLERAHPPGTALRVGTGSGRALEGLFDGLDRDGALLLRLPDGTRRVIHAGEVLFA